VKVRILPSSPNAGDLQHLITFVVDGHLAIDAGCLGFCGTPAQQAAVTGVVLTHSHADHICSLPIFATNVFDHTGRGVTVSAPAAVVECLKEDLFNWRVWPDFTVLHQNGQPLLTLETVEPRVPTMVGGLTLTAIPTNHPVPNVAYLVDDGSVSVLFVTDTGPTDEVWDFASRAGRLRAVFVDVAFPDEMTDLATISGHLTPSLARSAVKRLPEAVAKIAVHLKPTFRDRILEQVCATAVPRLTVGRLGYDYEF
jgi:ribonuclease BN (tRNA processing enzyme)